MDRFIMTRSNSRDADPSRGESAALDLLAEVLRSLGAHAFDLEEESAEEIRQHFEGWARHVLVGAAPPDRPNAAGGTPLEQRDWPGARRFTDSQRRRERDYVIRSLGNLRAALWAFIQGLGAVFDDDRHADGALEKHMDRVRRAVDGRSTDKIRREAIAAVGAMGEVLAERQRRQRNKLEALGERVRELRGELESARAEMERDALTQLYNRAALDQHLKRLTDLGALFGESASLLMVDIDDFKWVNDSFGHTTGDAVLCGVSAAFADLLRRREDFAARYGGDELTVAIVGEAADGAEGLAERLLQAARDVEVAAGPRPVRVTVSIGVATLCPGESPGQWIERADRALYQAKQDGRNRVRVAPPATPTA